MLVPGHLKFQDQEMLRGIRNCPDICNEEMLHEIRNCWHLKIVPTFQFSGKGNVCLAIYKYKHLECFVMLGTHSETHVCDISLLRVQVCQWHLFIYELLLNRIYGLGDMAVI